MIISDAEASSGGCCPSLCLRLCCCSCCCCHRLQVSRDKTREYPHVLYGQLQDTKDPHTHTSTGTDQQFIGESQIEKSYKYPQRYREYSIPPHMGPGGIVTEQPRGAEGMRSMLEGSPTHTGAEGTRSMLEGSPTHTEDTTDVGDIEDSLSMTSEGSLDDVGADVGFVDSVSLISKIERSPENSLERGEHLVFPSTRGYRKSPLSLKSYDTSLVKKMVKMRSETILNSQEPGIYFSLYYDETKAMLIVHVTEAVNLPTSRPNQTTNPYVQIYLLPRKSTVQQSHSVKGTHSPFFDHVFRFSGLSLDVLSQQILVMRCYVNLNHFVGGILYSFDEADLIGKRIVREIMPFDEEEGLKVTLIFLCIFGV